MESIRSRCVTSRRTWKMKAMSEDECIRIAHTICEQEGWPWLQPVRVKKGFFSWTVITNAESVNARIVIRKRDRQVMQKSFAPVRDQELPEPTVWPVGGNSRIIRPLHPLGERRVSQHATITKKSVVGRKTNPL